MEKKINKTFVIYVITFTAIVAAGMIIVYNIMTPSYDWDGLKKDLNKFVNSTNANYGLEWLQSDPGVMYIDLNEAQWKATKEQQRKDFCYSVNKTISQIYWKHDIIDPDEYARVYYRVNGITVAKPWLPKYSLDTTFIE